MPTVASRRGDAVSVAIDNAGADETIAIWHLRAGRFEKAALALRRAQHELLQAELALLERANAGAPVAAKTRGRICRP